jgi:peptide/nickel transport system substrate-binding protein
LIKNNFLSIILRPLLIFAVLIFAIKAYFPAGCLCDEPGPPEKCYGGTIIEGSIANARTLIPMLASDTASSGVASLIFNGLIKYDKNLNLTGDLASGWDVSEDGLEIIFYLRKNVKWQDGHPFTARDVKFTYEKLIDPKVPTPYSGDFHKVKDVSMPDDYTFKVVYKEPFSPGLSSWGMGVIPYHILKDEDLTKTKFSRDPVGMGPYKLKRWKTAELIELEYFEDYFEGRPCISRYVVRIIPDTATMFLELQTESVDFMGLTPLQYKRQTDGKFFKKKYRKYRYPSFGYTYLGFNLADKKFRDVRVREAIDRAIDKKEIIDGVLLGLGRVCTGPFVPESWAYNKDVEPVGYNPQEAKRLLADAGWEDSDGDGWIDKNNEAFEFSLITNQGNEQRKMAAEIIQKRLQEAGIKVKIRVLEWSTMLNEFINKKRFEAVLMGWSLARDPDIYDIWHSSKTKEGEFNFIGYDNDEVDRLLIEGRRTFDEKERKKIYNRIHRLIYDDHPCVFLYVPDALPVVHSRFHGIEPAPAGIGYNFIDWYVPGHLQRYKR